MSAALLTSLVFSLSMAPSKPASMTLGETMASVIKHTNSERSKQGVTTLRENDRLVLIAQEMAEDMAQHKVMSHTDSKGRGLETRVNAGSYAWSTIGENIAYGYTSPEAVVQGWIKSPGHYQNLINRDFTEIGVGVAVASNGRVYWAQVFGRPR